MNKTDTGANRTARRYGLLLLGWSLLVSGSLWWNMRQETRSTLGAAAAVAKANIDKDFAFRKWATAHGGVYVPPTEHTPPNPYLNMPDRDVVTSKGKELTLMNPAYILRELQTDFADAYGIMGHITSLKLLNPKNAPDAWEAEALRAFDQGETERVDVQQIEGRTYLRMMRPLVTEKGCLKCHGFQGYKEGDVRGGVSTSVYLEPYLVRERELKLTLALTHGAIWLIGLAGLGLSYRRDRRLGVAQMRAERELLEANVYNRSLIEASLDPLVTISAEGKITDVNRATEQVTGRSRSELIGTDFSDYFTEPDKARAGYRRVFEQGHVSDYPLVLRHRDGHVTDVLYNASVYRDEAGRVRGVFAAARDISELKQADAARMQLAAIVESSNDAIIGKTLQGIITSWNQGAEEIYGYSAADVIGNPITMLAMPAKHAEIHEFLEKIRRGQSVANYESERVRKDGTVIQVALTLSPIKDAAGTIVGISTIARDITEKKRMEAELRQASAYHRSLIEASLDPLVTISAEGKVTDVNRATETITGRSRAELVGTDFSEYFTEPARARAGYRRVFEQGYVTDYPLVLRHRDGHVTDVLYNASVYRNEAGEVQGVFAAARDITERKKAETVLRESEAALKEAQRIAHLGSWHMDLASGEIYWSEELYRMYGFDPALPPPLYSDSMKLFTPESWERLSTAISRAAEDGTPYELVLETVPKAGGRGWMWARGELVRDAQGKPSQVRGVVMDITARRQAEEELRRSEHSLAEAQRIAHLGNWELDLLSGALRWSDEIYRIFEIDKEKFGASYEAFLNAIHPDDRDMVNRAYTDSVANKAPYDIMHRLLMADGRIKYVNEKCETYYDAEGKPLRSVGTVHDITERVLDEQALQRLNRELRAISNCNQTLMRAEDEQALLDEICRIVCEDAGYRMAWVGYAEQDEGKTIRVVSRAGHDSGYLEQARLTWADTERGRGPSGRAIRSGQSVCIQDFLSDPNAAPWREAAEQRGYRSSIALPLKDDSGRTFGILNIYAAVPGAFTPEETRLLEELAGDMAFGLTVLRTRLERQRALEAVRDSELKYRMLIQNIQAAVVVHGADTRIQISNPMAQELLGLSEAQLTGKAAIDPDWHFYRENGTVAPHEEYPVSRVLASHLPLRNLVLGIHRPGREQDVWVLVNADPVFGSDGGIVEIIVTFIDISQRKQAEAQVRALNQELEQRVAARTAELETANKELEAFAYSVSHDLRTPLRAVDGFSNILLEDYRDKLDEEGKRLLNVVRDNATRMNQLIDDILKFSRAGRLELSFVPIDMAQLAREVLAELQPAPDEGRLQVEIEALPPALGDRAMMHQVIVNLLSNALKFSRERQPARIKVGSTVAGGETVYYVQDNGAGFDMQYADRLFGVFQRLHATTEFEGTGIGLAIIKRIVARHGGRVWAEGRVGEGATFYFALPRAVQDGGGEAA